MEFKTRFTAQEVLKILEQYTIERSGLQGFVASEVQALDYNEEEIDFDYIELTLHDETSRMFKPVAHILRSAQPEQPEVVVINEVEG